MHMQHQAVIWIPAAPLAQCQGEGQDKFPQETGGVFMGYWHGPHCAVVTAAIGPGPHAVHEHHNFEPDYPWQLSQIAAHYERSGRHETYIGDWHTHPGAITGHLSWTDRRVLRRIINTPAARSATPLMAIFHGEEDDWKLAVWRAHLAPRPILWPKLVIDDMTVRTFA
jgi:integrative and conjugative element protein (TIGR02256 family)